MRAIWSHWLQKLLQFDVIQFAVLSLAPGLIHLYYMFIGNTCKWNTFVLKNNYIFLAQNYVFFLFCFHYKFNFFSFVNRQSTTSETTLE